MHKMYKLVLLLICEGNFDYRASIDLLLNTSCLHSLHQSESAHWEEVKHAGEIPKQLSRASTPQEPVKHSVPLNLTKRGCTTPTLIQNTISTQLSLNSLTSNHTSKSCTKACSIFDKEHTTYNERLYLDEFMQRGFMDVLELFADVEEVDLGAGHHDTDESPVVCSQALQGKSQRLENCRRSLQVLWLIIKSENHCWHRYTVNRWVLHDCCLTSVSLAHKKTIKHVSVEHVFNQRLLFITQSKVFAQRSAQEI